MENIIKIEMMIENFGAVKIELYPEIAPETVENFVKLIKSGFYDGLTFHRIYPGFMSQGGDPEGNGSGGTETIKGEFSANGFKNDLSHTRGVISMARLGNDYDSASCQFFIMHEDSPFLDGQYAAFGKVSEGIEVIDAIADVECSFSPVDMANTKPLEPPMIQYIKVIEE